MGKRFTATEKWDDPWFCGLTERERLFWMYLCDKCDHAGIWQVNWMIAEVYFPGIRDTLDLERFGSRIVVLNPQKWFIVKFVKYQYGELNKDNRAHASVIAILQKEGAYKDLISPCLGAKGKVSKDKDKVKDVRKGSGETIPPGAFEMIWESYPRKEGKQDAERHFKAQVKTVRDWLDIQNSLDNFKKKLRREGTEEQYIPHGSTWFCSRWRDYVSYAVSSYDTAARVVESRPREPERELSKAETSDILSIIRTAKSRIKKGGNDEGIAE